MLNLIKSLFNKGTVTGKEKMDTETNRKSGKVSVKEPVPLDPPIVEPKASK